MKLKSLLLGSAAALALSTGAQAADPIVEFVSLGVCDAYGITGLTIESDDTCLSISGEVAYTWTGSNFDFLPGTELYASEVEWDLVFEATTQTDAGAAIAHISLNEADTASDEVALNEAYVSFGDTTVLSAGKIDSLYDTEVLDRTYGGDERGFFDWDLDEGELNAARADGRAVGRDGHGIQISSLVADGFRVMASLEDLDGTGTGTIGVAYDNAGVSAEVAVLLGDLYNDADVVNYYANVTAEFDSFEVRGAVLADDTGYFIASIGASAAFDMFSLDADAYFTEGDDWGVAGEGSFDATDTVAIYLGAGFEEVATIDIFTVYGGVNVDVTETLTANAELGYTDVESATDYIYGAAGITYAPGGGFETGINLYANTEDDYKFSFEASKEF